MKRFINLSLIILSAINIGFSIKSLSDNSNVKTYNTFNSFDVKHASKLISENQNYVDEYNQERKVENIYFVKEMYDNIEKNDIYISKSEDLYVFSIIISSIILILSILNLFFQIKK